MNVVKQILKFWNETSDQKYKKRRESKATDFKLYAADLGGYDITGEVTLTLNDDHFLLTFNHYDDSYYDLPLDDQQGRSPWLPKAQFKLIPSQDV